MGLSRCTPELSKTLSKGGASDELTTFGFILRLKCCSGSCFLKNIHQRGEYIVLLIVTSNNTRTRKVQLPINNRRRSLSRQKIKCLQNDDDLK